MTLQRWCCHKVIRHRSLYACPLSVVAPELTLTVTDIQAGADALGIIQVEQIPVVYKNMDQTNG